MQRLIFPRHSAYCAAHNIDFWNFQGGKYPEFDGEAGAWMKVGLIRDALKDYEYVFWIDVDAAIVDFETDLRDSVKDINIGAVSHNPDKSDWLKLNKIDEHINVGVIYVRNTDISNQFIDKWFESYPGPKRWADQGAFNECMKEMPEAVTCIDDKWNATINVNMVENPVVYAWHGVPITERFLLMKQRLKDDHLIYTV
jgi:hypothetical protein